MNSSGIILVSLLSLKTHPIFILLSVLFNSFIRVFHYVDLSTISSLPKSSIFFLVSSKSKAGLRLTNDIFLLLLLLLIFFSIYYVLFICLSRLKAACSYSNFDSTYSPDLVFIIVVNILNWFGLSILVYTFLQSPFFVCW